MSSVGTVHLTAGTLTLAADMATADTVLYEAKKHQPEPHSRYLLAIAAE